MSPPPRILFVDDDVELLSSFTDLWGLDYEVATAPSGATAIARLAEWTPDVIVSDMRMPGMDGATFLAKARALDPGPTRILLTGHSDLEAAVRAVNEGAVFRFLTKPCEQHEMASSLDAAVGVRRAEQDLRRQRANMTDQLVHTERLSTLGTMSATLGHELNNTLSLLQLAIDDVVRDAATHRPTTAETAELLVTGKERLIRQSTGALALARRSAHDHGPLDVAAIVEELAGVLRASGVVRRVRFDLVFRDRDVRILGDRTELEQILVNLIKNAVDAVTSKPNPTEVGRVRVTVGRAGDLAELVEVRVTDTGTGIGADQLARIFEPYFTTKPPGSGTGLGLPVVQQLTERAHGLLVVTSEVGRGTEFVLSFPAVA